MKRIAWLSMMILAALALAAAPALAEEHCLKMHPGGGPEIKVQLSNDCGNVTGMIKYIPQGASKSREIQVKGYGTGITKNTDSYCLIKLSGGTDGQLMCDATIKLHLTGPKGQREYTSVDYEINVLQFDKNMDDEHYTGSEAIHSCM